MLVASCANESTARCCSCAERMCIHDSSADVPSTAASVPAPSHGWPMAIMRVGGRISSPGGNLDQGARPKRVKSTTPDADHWYL